MSRMSACPLNTRRAGGRAGREAEERAGPSDTTGVKENEDDNSGQPSFSMSCGLW